MRIVLNAGIGAVGQLQNDLNRLHNDIQSSIQALQQVIHKIHGVASNAQNLTSAASSMQIRLRSEQHKLDAVETLSKKSNTFLSNAVATDKQVARIVTQNQNQFYKENPWARPVTVAEPSIWERIGNGIQGAKKWLGNLWTGTKETLKNVWSGIKSAAETAWNGVVSFVKKHAVELVVGTCAIVIGALCIALTGGAATPFVAAFGAALLKGFAAAGISAVVSGAISSLTALFTGENLWQSFWDGAASGFITGGLFFMFSGMVSLIKFKVNLPGKGVSSPSAASNAVTNSVDDAAGNMDDIAFIQEKTGWSRKKAADALKALKTDVGSRTYRQSELVDLYHHPDFADQVRLVRNARGNWVRSTSQGFPKGAQIPDGFKWDGMFHFREVKNYSSYANLRNNIKEQILKRQSAFGSNLDLTFVIDADKFSVREAELLQKFVEMTNNCKIEWVLK